jgi:peptidoglycan/LPS O-acetylase OafA/YrhL
VSLQYRSEIDGLRALAIIPVVFFHGGFSLVSGGFVGVDVFFVISGYLITLLIYNDLVMDSFSAKKFYERRIKRLFPALFFIAACCSVIAWFLYLPFDLEDYYANLASVFNFSSNIHFYIHSGYFDPSSELNALLHTWSLTVEEQFYFVFPWFLLLAFKLGRKAVWVGVCSLIIISFCLAEWRLQDKPMAAFYLLYARGWELLIGSFCALLVSDSQLLSKVSNQVREMLAWLGLVMILYSIFFFTDSTPAAGRYTLIPTIGTALILLFARTKGYLGQFLSNRLFVSIGLISYSTYLWHQPMLAFSRYYIGGDLDWVLAGTLCLFSFVLGYISWQFIEKPFRYGAFFWSNQRKVYATMVVLSASMFMLGIYGKNEKGFPERLDSSVRSIYETPKNYEQVDSCFLLNAGVFDLPGCIDIKETAKNALIVGDSHAASLFPSLKRDLADKGWSLTMLSYTDCVPFIGNKDMQVYRFNSNFIAKRVTSRCEKIRESLKAEVKKHDFDLIIVLNHYNDWVGPYRNDSFPEFMDLYLDAMVDVFDEDKLMVLGSLPVWSDDLPKLIVKDYAQGKNFTGPSFDGLVNKDRNLDTYMAQALSLRGIQFLSSMEALCSPAGCVRTGTLESGETLAVAYDEAHLSAAGSKILSTYIVSAIEHFSLNKKI